MAEQTAGTEPGAKAVISGVMKKALIVTAAGIAVAVVVQLAFRPDLPFWTVPAGVLVGSALGVVNFRWLAVAVERVYLRQGTTGAAANLAAAVITVLKLSTIFVAIFIVIKYRLVNILGLVAGLSCCFLAILWQGMTAMTSGPAERGDRS